MNEILIPGIRFIVTSLCNYNCSYCHNEWEPKKGPISELEEKLIEELIEAARTLGAGEVDVTGGEPLLKPERVRTIFKIAKKKGMQTNLTTNGYFLERDSHWLVDLGLDEMHIHIPSLNLERYRELMRGNANLNQVLKGLESVKSGVPTLKANIPIQPGINDGEIPDFISEFNRQGITPRFIETMATISYEANEQRIFDEFVKSRINGSVSLKKSYLWGINEYDSREGKFETLRCICFDRKCDICPRTNFIHVDQDYKIRPCNLRPFRIQASRGKSLDQMREAVSFLEQQTDIPDQYKRLWGESYLPLSLK